MACRLGHFSVRILTDLPELVQVKILTRIDLTSWVLISSVLVFPAKEVLNLRVGRLGLLSLTTRYIQSQLGSMLDQTVERALSILL